MRHRGINPNIMSLGGTAIAIGAMVDAALAMIENAHEKIEAWQHAHPGQLLQGEERGQVMTDAAVEVGAEPGAAGALGHAGRCRAAAGQ
jgi:Cu(I)/Ag(I) efflux system membrane protein CusA/SilA